MGSRSVTLCCPVDVVEFFVTDVFFRDVIATECLRKIPSHFFVWDVGQRRCMMAARILR